MLDNNRTNYLFQEQLSMKSIKKIAILTSGGDAPGMNAALKGVVRAALNRGWEVYGIRDAFQGLVEGGEKIYPLDWVDVNWSFREGGTFLGSARYPEIKGNSTKGQELKERALLNLKGLGISGLVVIGGDGSLSGAYSLYTTLKKNGHLNPRLNNMDLSIVGIPGSIDNDIAYTDMSIGVDTTLNTIIECIDKLRDTATSHRRVIIVEVMGRRRGYLAVLSGLAAGADRIFIREEKIRQKELNNMLHMLQESFSHGQRAGIIVRSEGARFSTSFLKETLDVLLEPKREVRETILGHLQRGGIPTIFERTLAIRMGVKAVQLLEEVLPEPQILGLEENKIKFASLAKSIETIMTPSFQDELSVNTQNSFHLSKMLEHPPEGKSKGTCISILTDGNNVSGMNMAIRAVARIAINEGIEVKGIKGGFAGLRKGPESVLNLEWSMLEMKSILRRAGTLLGVSSNMLSVDQKDFSTIKKHVENLNIDGLIAIGNSESYQYAHKLSQAIKIPVVGIPADLNCNLPGTDWVIGMDSALNNLLEGLDRAADAAHVKRKIFIIHLKGEYCSCAVKLAVLGGGIEELIIDERISENKDKDIFKSMVRKKIEQVKRIIDLGKTFATIIFFSKHHERSEDSIQFIKQTIKDIGITLETTIISLETSYGGIVPTAFDRVLAKRLGEKAMAILKEKMDKKDHSLHVVGLKGKLIEAKLYKNTEIGPDCKCSKDLETDLEHCIHLMSQPSEICIGLGGDIEWTNIGERKKWQGKWTCKKCGQSQTFSMIHGKMLYLYCENEMCRNYGYIRISRRL